MFGGDLFLKLDLDPLLFPSDCLNATDRFALLDLNLHPLTNEKVEVGVWTAVRLMTVWILS